MSLLTASNVSKFYGGTEIFRGVSGDLSHKARTALVGPNGAGKTTLIKLFIGEEAPTDGQIHVAKTARVGYLPQRPELYGGHTLWEEVLSAFDELRTMETRLGELAIEMADNPSVVEEYGALQEEFERRGGYDYEARVKMVLSGVGFDKDDYEMPLAKLSGGQKTRAMLGRLLLEAPELLILDEPTNHLDIYAVEWLESYLKDYTGAVLAISHDRRFIDNFANEVWEMEFGRMEVYRGNYTHYLQQRDERRERLQKEYEAQQEYLAKEMDYIRKHMGSQNTAQAKGRLKRLNTMKKRGKIIERGPRDRKAMVLNMQAEQRSGDQVLKTRDLVVGYDPDEPLFHFPDVVLLRGETAAIIGPNGAGKSTLLKTIIKTLKPLDGTVRLGAAVEIGYFAQAHEGLNPASTILDVIMEAGEMGIAEARDFLGRYLFSGDDVFRTIETLSGGERGRVALARLALSGANLLLLDEPTNHLDIDSQEILQAVIEGFEGTVLLVSHDRYLIDGLATQIWAITPEHGIEVFEGTYNAFMQSRRQRQEATTTAANGDSTSSRRKPAQYSEKVRGMNPYELRKYVAKLEDRITSLESALEDLVAQIDLASAAGDGAKVQSLGTRYAETEAALEAALDEWSELAEHVD